MTSPQTHKEKPPTREDLRRLNTRLSTVYGGKLCQYGKSYPCLVFDVSGGGAKVQMKNPHDFLKITNAGNTQLIFDRLSDYKALNADVAWVKSNEFVVGLKFTDPEIRSHFVLKRLMPSRWKVALDAQTRDKGSEENE